MMLFVSGRQSKERGIGYENGLVLLLALGGGVAALDAQSVFYLMPFLATDLSLDNLQIGMIGSAVLIGWSLSALATAWASDRLGKRKPFLVGAFLCFALFSVASAFAASFAVLLAARLLMGMAEGPVIPIKQSIMLAESSPHRRGLNMGIVQNFGAQLIGSLMAPILLVWIATGHGWQAGFLVAAIPGLVIACLIAIFVREPARPAQPAQSGTDGAALKLLLATRNVRLCMLIGTCAVGWNFMLLTFLPLWMVRQLGLSPQLMSIIVGTIGLAGAVSAILVPGLSDRIGRRTAVSCFALLGIVAPLGVLFAGPDPILLCALVFIGCLMLGTFPLFMATIPLETVPPSMAAFASALIIATSQIAGGVLGPLAGGALADRFGLQAPLWVACVLAAAAAGASLWLIETGYAREKSRGEAA